MVLFAGVKGFEVVMVAGGDIVVRVVGLVTIVGDAHSSISHES